MGGVGRSGSPEEVWAKVAELDTRQPHDEESLPVSAAARDAHPLLDPNLAERRPEVYRALFRAQRFIQGNDAAYAAFLNRSLYPPETDRPLESSCIEMAYYLNEASRYIEELLDLLPRRRRARFHPLQRVAVCNDMRRLLSTVFEARGRRSAFEAQRKICLGKLFFDVDHTWEVQRGEIHRDFLTELLQRRLFRSMVEERDVDIAFNIAADGVGIDYRVGRPLPEQEAWRFRRQTLEIQTHRRPVRINVYFYSCRSKREVLPYRYVRGQRIHAIRAVEKWNKLSLRRDASIISKMLRKGVSDPGAIPDILGIMFIVGGLTEVDYLKQALFDILGGPLRLRDIVDTLNRPDANGQLNPYSGAGYKVYKAEMDVLFENGDQELPPYSFSVELQIYTLEGYLRTIHTRHYASHQRLKRRQFLEGLAPILFPEEIYGARIDQ